MARSSGIKIMVVDDDKEFLEEVLEMLSSSGYEIIIASDGVSALEDIKREKPNLILLDLKMTPKSGFEVAKELINLPGLKDTAIIAMTGFFTEKEHTLLMNMCGIRTCILKPIKPSDLVAKIEFALDAKRKEKHHLPNWN